MQIFPPITDSKEATNEDGAILIQNEGCRVTLNGRSAIIKVYNFHAGSIQHRVSLDFGSTGDRQSASPQSQAIIERLFPEYV
jgi:hypothetical protein